MLPGVSGRRHAPAVLPAGAVLRTEGRLPCCPSKLSWCCPVSLTGDTLDRRRVLPVGGLPPCSPARTCSGPLAPRWRLRGRGTSRGSAPARRRPSRGVLAPASTAPRARPRRPPADAPGLDRSPVVLPVPGSRRAPELGGRPAPAPRCYPLDVLPPDRRRGVLRACVRQLRYMYKRLSSGARPSACASARKSTERANVEARPRRRPRCL